MVVFSIGYDLLSPVFTLAPNPRLRKTLNRELRGILEMDFFFRVVGVFRGSLGFLYWHGS